MLVCTYAGTVCMFGHHSDSHNLTVHTHTDDRVGCSLDQIPPNGSAYKCITQQGRNFREAMKAMARVVVLESGLGLETDFSMTRSRLGLAYNWTRT